MASNDWSEWQKHVLAELKRLSSTMESFESKNNEDHKDIFTTLATLKVKSRVWGALGGIIPGSVALIWFLIYYLAK